MPLLIGHLSMSNTPSHPLRPPNLYPFLLNVTQQALQQEHCWLSWATVTEDSSRGCLSHSLVLMCSKPIVTHVRHLSLVAQKGRVVDQKIQENKHQSHSVVLQLLLISTRKQQYIFQWDHIGNKRLVVFSSNVHFRVSTETGLENVSIFNIFKRVTVLHYKN